MRQASDHSSRKRRRVDSSQPLGSGSQPDACEPRGRALAVHRPTTAYRETRSCLRAQAEGGVWRGSCRRRSTLRRQVPLLLPPLIHRRLHPARFPEVDVKMDDGEAGLGRQRSRERALPCSGHASDSDASSDRNPGWDVPCRSTLGDALIRHQRILPKPGRALPALLVATPRFGSGGCSHRSSSENRTG
jgi:hypothetical protein